MLVLAFTIKSDECSICVRTSTRPAKGDAYQNFADGARQRIQEPLLLMTRFTTSPVKDTFWNRKSESLMSRGVNSFHINIYIYDMSVGDEIPVPCFAVNRRQDAPRLRLRPEMTFFNAPKASQQPTGDTQLAFNTLRNMSSARKPRDPTSARSATSARSGTSSARPSSSSARGTPSSSSSRPSGQPSSSAPKPSAQSSTPKASAQSSSRGTTSRSRGISPVKSGGLKQASQPGLLECVQKRFEKDVFESAASKLLGLGMKMPHRAVLNAFLLYTLRG